MKTTKVPGAPSRFTYHLGCEIDPDTGMPFFGHVVDVQTFLFFEFVMRVLDKPYWCSLDNERTAQLLWFGPEVYF